MGEEHRDCVCIKLGVFFMFFVDCVAYGQARFAQRIRSRLALFVAFAAVEKGKLRVRDKKIVDFTAARTNASRY